MGKLLKIILSIVLAIILLAVIAVGVAVIFIRPNDFKPQIVAEVKAKTGRDLVIDGDLTLTFFPALGLSTGKMTLSNTPPFQPQPFATLDESEISVELLPLLSKKIDVSGIVLKGLTLNLTTNQQGEKNWQTLTSGQTIPVAVNTTPTPAAQQLTDTALGTFAIAHVSLVNAQINWQNLQTGKNRVIKDLNLTTDKLAFNQPIAIDLALVTDNVESKTNVAVKFNTVLSVNEQFDNVALTQSRLQAVTTGDAIPNKSLTSELTIADSSLSLSQQNFKVQGLQLKAADLSVAADFSGEHIQDNPVLQGTVSLSPFSPAKLMKDFAIPLPVMRDANALNKMAMSFNFTTGKNSLVLQNIVLNIDDTTIKGVSNLLPEASFYLAIDALDADRYLPPVEKTKKPITSPTIALMAGATAIPVETLKKLNINGDLTVAKLKINDLNLQDVQLHLTAKDGLITSSQAIKQFYQGEYSGHLVVDTRQIPTTLAINEQLNHVQVEPLLQDFRGKAKLSGTVDAATQLQGKGRTALELKSSLKGFLKFVCKDGAIIGFSLQKMLDKAKALFKGADLAVQTDSEQTPFVEISGTAAVNNGLITNQDLLARTNKVRLTGNGTAHLVTEQLDYKLTANLLKEKAIANTPEQFHEAAIVIAVGGTFTQPTYTLDVSALITDKAKEKVEQLLDRVQTEENKAKINNALDKLKPEDKEKIQKIAPKLGKFFKKLL